MNFLSRNSFPQRMAAPFRGLRVANRMACVLRSHSRLSTSPQTNTEEPNMARSKGASLPLALELLTSDHRKVEGLFQMYEDEKEGDDETKRGIAQKISGELTAHAQVEEELF